METLTERRNPIGVLLVDESILTTEGLRRFLSKSTHIVVVGTANTAAEAISAIETCRPNVVILDVQIGRTNGIDLGKSLHESHPDIGILFFTAQDDPHLLRSAICAGAKGYLLKSASSDAVVNSIELVSAGRAIVDPHLAHHLITWIRDSARTPRHYTIDHCSHEERRILSLVAAGKTNKEIAQALKIAPNVAATRLQRIYKRLRISRKSEAASYVTRHEQSLLPKLHQATLQDTG